MDLIRINVRGVEASVWDEFASIQQHERVAMGKLLSDAISAFIEGYYDADEALTDSEA